MRMLLLAFAGGAAVLGASMAYAGQLPVAGPAALPRYSYVADQRPDLGAAIAGALAGAALELIPRAAETLLTPIRPSSPGQPPPAERSAPQPPPAAAASPTPAAAATKTPPAASPPSDEVLADIEGNPRGVTREEVEAALVDWCASNGEAPLCRKLQVR
jgi:hypothetical protein